MLRIDFLIHCGPFSNARPGHFWLSSPFGAGDNHGWRDLTHGEAGAVEVVGICIGDSIVQECTFDPCEEQEFFQKDRGDEMGFYPESPCGRLVEGGLHSCFLLLSLGPRSPSRRCRRRLIDIESRRTSRSGPWFWARRLGRR